MQQQSVEGSIMSSFNNKEFIIPYTKKSGGKATPALVNSAASWDTIQKPDSFSLFIPQHLTHFPHDLNVAAEPLAITSSPNNIQRWWVRVTTSCVESVIQISESFSQKTPLAVTGPNCLTCPCANVTSQGNGIVTFGSD